MDEDAAQTVREIEETRQRLDADVRELEERLPDRAAWKRRMVPVAAVAGGGTVLWVVVRGIRRRREAQRRSAPVRAVVQVLPEEWTERISQVVRERIQDDRWKPWVAGAAGVWVVFRMAELRQLRRMNRALLGAR